MNYASIKYCDIANGVGVRTSLFVSGCRLRCPGCFNSGAWSFHVGDPFTVEVEDRILESLSPSYVDGLSVLGGEPTEPENATVLAPFLERVRAAYPAKDIWLYSGRTWEEFTGDGDHASPDMDRILATLDVLVDGPFVRAEYDIGLRFRGSRNQRLIDVPRSLATGEVVLWEDEAVYATHGW
ncbi:ribonucleoside-triphosphate reductase class III activase subunit [Olsenella uli DSM 7084]|uniref:Anaerobic ribonucleoside-triphosphate reductase-activating protein n=1 Tax=Olsenella uli (strain ATCC 49627 / DSM 7084 / CCUG 31166 / CIP 109912 / JCM 12494 / LMG 11480 / NCIMB 702895 / VPI D76D-27C) TaxID=633147 RepID=E1QWU6_OLSUV|nr:anaerobic ribonucleoside-triphosphate reductase activating protein [Olsenella uli]ADK68599.1 ribonucleoside-triphosphate reductase class III activase subunit [Olsenella uli DSM 7084]KRO12592.1 ribonucleoside-triphosphate reductase class III activase subunit [Olsenella uli DSM 7084]